MMVCMETPPTRKDRREEICIPETGDQSRRLSRIQTMMIPMIIKILQGASDER